MTYQIDELLNTAPCGFLSFTDDGTIVMVNATLLELLGHELDGLRGRKIESILPIASRIFYQTHFFPLLKLHGKAEEIYFSLRPRQGSDIPMLVNAVRRENAGSFVNNCIFVPIRQRIQYEDEILKAKKEAEVAILAQKQAEIALRQQYERAILLRDITQRINQSLDLSNIFEIASQKIRELIHADRVGIFKFYSDAHYNDGEFVAESVLQGFNSHLARKIHDHCFGKQYASYYQQGRIQALDDIDNAGLADCHRRILAKLQIRANLVVPLLNAGEDLWGLLCIHQCSAPRHWQELEIDFIKQIAIQLTIAIQQSDLFQKSQKELAEREQAEARLRESNQQLAFSNEELACATRLLEKLVNIDGLTQIANRRCFNDRLLQEWLRLCREQQPLSLLLFDVDYFKRYNDFYGHQLGDDCLTKLAQAAQQVVWRPADLVARYGGEEFVIILPNTDAEGAGAVAERVHAAMQALNIPHQASEVSNTVTISLGIATLIPSSEISPAILIAQADQALYCAKQQGRNQSVIFSF
ncbi:PAS domain S-box/diguanylate cyclase (GGDEF) domain-containing protein [Cylindrospermum stagnale PCC 7417]|uniref:PAS domain S-box/diguanylate cyclase (GGDEF) domain-containing protein n=1 Tax=Cylindrospermum stagnale PCC 7417 TaxID=56107 RepID=K9X4J2_9NOST|nr:diguanylate cyclase [Cylindrospermum stagnale]AFZ27029.1 PAS domain S-box/diguanylate cyclase (GGDEF) domain-containing protein [Cylindrospermum stagnale PCC 7417]